MHLKMVLVIFNVYFEFSYVEEMNRFIEVRHYNLNYCNLYWFLERDREATTVDYNNDSG